MNANNTPTSVTVRPCPFCGGKDMSVVEINMGDDQRQTFMGCHTCGSSGPCTFSDEKAVAAWNERTATAPKHRPAEVLTGKDRRNIGDALFQGNIHVEYVLPLHAAPDAMSLSAGWEALAERLEDMDEDQVETIFDDYGFACIAEALDCADGEAWLCSFRKIGGWVIMGSYATVGNIKLKEDGKFASCSVYCGIEHELIVWGRTYKQAIARAINEQRHYFNGEVEKAREAAGYGRA